MKKIINLRKNLLSCSKFELIDYEIIILNRGWALLPRLKSKVSRTLQCNGP